MKNKSDLEFDTRRYSNFTMEDFGEVIDNHHTVIKRIEKRQMEHSVNIDLIHKKTFNVLNDFKIKESNRYNELNDFKIKESNRYKFVAFVVGLLAIVNIINSCENKALKERIEVLEKVYPMK